MKLKLDKDRKRILEHRAKSRKTDLEKGKHTEESIQAMETWYVVLTNTLENFSRGVSYLFAYSREIIGHSKSFKVFYEQFFIKIYFIEDARPHCPRL